MITVKIWLIIKTHSDNERVYGVHNYIINKNIKKSNKILHLKKDED